MKREESLLNYLVLLSILNHTCQGLRESNSTETISGDRNRLPVPVKQVAHHGKNFAEKQTANSGIPQRGQTGTQMDGRLRLLPSSKQKATKPWVSRKLVTPKNKNGSERSKTAHKYGKKWETFPWKGISENDSKIIVLISPEYNKEKLLREKKLNESDFYTDQDKGNREEKENLTIYLSNATIKLTAYEDTSKLRPQLDRIQPHNLETSVHHGSIAGNKLSSKDTKNVINYVNDDPAQTGNSKDSTDTVMVTMAMICIGIAGLPLIVSGLVYLWKNQQHLPQKCFGSKLGFVISLNQSGAIDDLSGEDIIYERSSGHFAMCRGTESKDETSRDDEIIHEITDRVCKRPTPLKENRRPTSQISQGDEALDGNHQKFDIKALTPKVELRDVLPITDNADVGAEREFSDGGIIYDSATCHLAAFTTQGIMSTTEAGSSISPQDSYHLNNYLNKSVSVYLGYKDDEECRDEGAIYNSSSCHVTGFKDMRPTSNTTEPMFPSSPQTSQGPFNKHSSCVLVNIDSDDEFSDGEVIYDSSSFHAGIFKKLEDQPRAESGCKRGSKTSSRCYEVAKSNEMTLEDFDGDDELSDGEMSLEKLGVPVTIDIGGELSDGEIIHCASKCHIVVQKNTSNVSVTPPCPLQSSQASTCCELTLESDTENADSFENLECEEIVEDPGSLANDNSSDRINTLNAESI